jgi:hypothetical protein
MIDRVAAELGRAPARGAGGLQVVRPRAARRLLGFGGEESAGASFLRATAPVWTTDKDGIILACWRPRSPRHGQGSRQHYREITNAFGAPVYTHRRPPPRRGKKAQAALARAGQSSSLAGEPIRAKLTKAPGNGAAIGGLKVTTEKTAGSPRGRRAPRTSTRSTPRASAGTRDGAQAAHVLRPSPTAEPPTGPAVAPEPSAHGQPGLRRSRRQGKLDRCRGRRALGLHHHRFQRRLDALHLRRAAAADGTVMHNRYRRVFLGLANDTLDEDGEPLPAGEKNYLELYGIPPSFGVLRERFLANEQQTCHATISQGKVGRGRNHRLRRAGEDEGRRAAHGPPAPRARGRTSEEQGRHPGRAGPERSTRSPPR